MRTLFFSGNIALLLTLLSGCKESERKELDDRAEVNQKQIVSSDTRTAVVHIEGFKKSKSGAI